MCRRCFVHTHSESWFSNRADFNYCKLRVAEESASMPPLPLARTSCSRHPCIHRSVRKPYDSPATVSKTTAAPTSPPFPTSPRKTVGLWRSHTNFIQNIVCLNVRGPIQNNLSLRNQIGAKMGKNCKLLRAQGPMHKNSFPRNHFGQISVSPDIFFLYRSLT